MKPVSPSDLACDEALSQTASQEPLIPEPTTPTSPVVLHWSPTGSPHAPAAGSSSLPPPWSSRARRRTTLSPPSGATGCCGADDDDRDCDFARNLLQQSRTAPQFRARRHVRVALDLGDDGDGGGWPLGEGLLSLPAEILGLVLAALSTADALGCLRTSHRFLSLARQSPLWEHLSVPAHVSLALAAHQLERLMELSARAGGADGPFGREAAASRIRSLELASPSADTLAELGRTCPRLVSLCATGFAAPLHTLLFAPLPELTTLCFSDSPACVEVTLAFLPLTPRLHELQLHAGVRPSATDDGLELARALAEYAPKLRSLRLSWRPFGSEALAAVARGCAALETLCLVGCGMGNDALAAVPLAKGLAELDLSYSSLTNAQLDTVRAPSKGGGIYIYIHTHTPPF